ncbi:phosphoribosylamine--glycine ligase [Acetonema longum]|uniref:Phosphoribosylamine--glycine ligase n=1 Tax=Acetonema longum DSM 6540 TaxID=1009370 RepID=F7NEM2_9FIRM|nr:phosphoribosylamine--glycine ligase [Acetonema longum]EGO65433.1 phosphoribosylamine/glycine ligase [Acetonema longum DSM 6540]
MKILVIGSGGREHALVWKLAQSPRVQKIFCVPGNPGIGEMAECVALDSNDSEALCSFARQQGIDLTVVGPEGPLSGGIVDLFTAHGLRIFGPGRQAAEIESSKAFAKDLMAKYQIPTAGYAVFQTVADAKEYIRQKGAPLVVKADGLAAGKGVIVAMTVNEALMAVDAMLTEQAFGAAGSRVVIEEFMQGEEASILTFTDGATVKTMVAAQDHKRVYDGDQGPNTGGMGAYAPAPVVTPELMTRIQQEILQPVVDAMRREGRTYKGCLYLGVMLTDAGPKVVEFNARFGDPETQVVLPLLASDLLPVMEACIDGTLAETEIKWRDQAAVCVVMAAGGYPGTYRKGDPITGLETAAGSGAMVFHAGTALKEGKVTTAGGRVLGMTAVGDGIRQALSKAYQALENISFPGAYFRRDIGHRAINGKN